MDKITADVIRASIHDLKGPVARLPLLAQLISRRFPLLDSDTQRLFEHINTSASEVGATVDALSKYLEICSRPMQITALDLSVPLEAAVFKLKGRLESAGAEVKYSGLPVVQGDSFLIAWLFEEMLTNALRHGSVENPRIYVAGFTDGDGKNFVALSDNGRGVDAGQEERIFRPFVSLGEEGGPGLGLAICRKILDLHTGCLWFHAKPHGAEFRFSIPC